jgi:uncharacterized protein (UPF0276 family)
VSEHVAFCRAGGMEAGHLLPVPRTRAALDVLTENVTIAQAALPVPLAVENIAALVSWPEDEMTEGAFLTELVERTGVLLLVDVANLYTAQVNFGAHPVPEAILDVLAALAERVRPPGVLLERDDAYPADSELAAELASIRAVVDRSRPRTPGLAARSGRAVG